MMIAKKDHSNFPIPKKLMWAPDDESQDDIDFSEGEEEELEGECDTGNNILIMFNRIK
jgi:hypothetical protein